MPNFGNRLLLFSVGVLMVLAFAFQGSRGLWAPDEGYYVAGLPRPWWKPGIT